MTSTSTVGDPLLNDGEGDASPSEKVHFADIDLKTYEGVTYALAHNGRPFIKALRIRPVTASFGPIEVKISARWAASAVPPVKPFSKVVDVVAESENWITVDVRDCRLDDVALAKLEVDSPAQIVLELFDRHTGNWQVHTQDVRIHSRTQWLMSQPEITAAFVQPHHPSIPKILNDAALLLEASTGSSAIDGYQGLSRGEFDRPEAIARAIFDALSHHISHYINPPASFNEKIGQLLRPLDQILADKHGTCLDLACAYASLLEQAGLHPLVFLVHHHAFTAFWKRPKTMSQAAISSFAAIINPYESGDIVPVEATKLPGGEGKFDESVQVARAHFTERLVNCGICQKLAGAGHPVSDNPHMDTAVDITACRSDRIFPLPAIVKDEGTGTTTVVIYSPGGAPPIIERTDEKGRRLPNSPPARVQQWKNALLDLSFRNRLLKFSPSASGLGLLTGPGLIAQIEDLVNENKPISIFSSDSVSEVRREAFEQILEAAFGVKRMSEAVRRHGSRSVQQALEADLTGLWNESNAVFGFTDSGSVPTRTKNLIRDARVEEQDTGVNNLHLTFGALKWSVPGSNVGEVTSPIFLVPVKMLLKRGALVPELRLDDDSSTTLNYCLVEALRARANLELDWFKRDIRDNAGLNIEEGLRQLRDEITHRGLDVRGGYEVIDSLAIGLLRFNKIRLWKDLDEHWEHFGRSPVVNHFLNRVGQPFQDPVLEKEGNAVPLDDTVLLNPQPADGAQSVAIQRAISGQTFVLEGPPGTGKSQTITNLLANALAQGMKVLFVAEKQAALDVVNERLKEVGLAPFCLDLHDKGSTTKQIREQLLEALDFQPNNKSAQWDREAIEFAAVVERLTKYRDDLHSHHIGGLSYYDAYRRLLELGSGEAMPVGRDITGQSRESLDQLRRNFAGLETYTDAAQPQPGHPWSMARLKDFSSLDRAALSVELAETLAHHEHLASSQSELAALVLKAGSPSDLDVALTIANLEVNLTPALLQQASRSQWRNNLHQLILKATHARDELKSSVGSVTGRHWTVDRSATIAAVTAASTSFPIGRAKRINNALGVFATAPALSGHTAKTVVASLTSLLAQVEEAVASVAQIEAALSGFQLLDREPYTANVLEVANDRLEAASTIADRAAVGDDFAKALMAYVATPMIFPEADLAALKGFRSALQTLRERLLTSDESWQQWLNKETLHQAVCRSRDVWEAGLSDQRFITLNRWVSLVNAVVAFDVPGLKEAQLGILDGSVAGRGAATSFERGLAEVVLAVAGEQAQFDIFDHHDQNRKVSQFIASLSRRQDLLKSVIPHMLHTRRSFDSTADSGRIGKFRLDLKSAKRTQGSQSIRQMIQNYGDFITELTPCFLMSPDSVAKFISPKSIQFDLVVFDEASQIPVADAIGALGRASSAVIVGDSKQMPPTSVAQAVAGGGEEELIPVSVESDQDSVETEPVPEDSDSILEECVDSGIDDESLSWHYRSRDEVLITFSNEKYYKGKLASFPSPSILQPGCGIEYHRLDGQFDHGKTRTNRQEADAIVADVLRRVHDPIQSQFSIGVVTFNMEQRRLITQKLIDTDDPLVLNLLETDDKEQELFVLNLESVQGRERDVIILGTAFSKKADGSAMPLNFGPLTNPRGERRLNVAVTRARRQMVIYSSFDPEDLAGATSTGMVDLRGYLTLAKQAGLDPGQLERAATPTIEDPYIDEIADAVASRGHIVRRGYGLSAFKVDVAIAAKDNPGHFRVGVLADGRSWGGRKLVLDRDALPVTVLQNLMNWPFIVRVWLPSWQTRREEILDQIDSLLSQGSDQHPDTSNVYPVGHRTEIQESPIEGESDESKNGDGTPSVGLPKISTVSSVSRPFIPWTPRKLGSSEDIDQLTPRVRAALIEIVETEGPIERDELLKKVANAFGLQRVREQRLVALRDLVPKDQCVTTPFGTYVYPRQLIADGAVVDSFSWYRLPADGRRDLASLSMEELGNLCRDIALRSGGVSILELSRALLTSLGYGRVAADTAQDALSRVQFLVDKSWLSARDGYIIG